MAKLQLSIISFLAFFVSFAFSYLIADPLQKKFLSEAFLGSLIFLPHGVRVLSVLLVGWRSLPFLFLAELAGMVAFWPNQISLVRTVASSFVGAISCFMALLILQAACRMSRPSNIGCRLSFIGFLTLAAVGSLINTTGKVLALPHHIEPYNILYSAAGFLFGDILGSVAFLIVLVISLRHSDYMTIRST